jgi:small subunit ribosomal protein S16
MVKIKLVRHGAKRSPFYKIVATDSRNAGDGKALERLGFFNPMARGQEVRLNLDIDRVNHWVSEGAQLSERVGTLIKQSQKTA